MTITPEELAQMRANAIDRLGRPAMPDPLEAQRTINLCDAVAEAWYDGHIAGARDQRAWDEARRRRCGAITPGTPNPYQQETDR